MGCELDKVVEAINKVAGEVKDSRAINQLNELKSDLTKFATSMEVAKPNRDFSKLRDVVKGTTDKEVTVNIEVIGTVPYQKSIDPSVFDKVTYDMKRGRYATPINSQIAQDIQGCNK